MDKGKVEIDKALETQILSSYIMTRHEFSFKSAFSPFSYGHNHCESPCVATVQVKVHKNLKSHLKYCASVVTQRINKKSHKIFIFHFLHFPLHLSSFSLCCKASYKKLKLVSKYHSKPFFTHDTLSFTIFHSLSLRFLFRFKDTNKIFMKSQSKSKVKE